MRYDRLAAHLVQAHLFGRGLLSTLPTCATGFVRTDDGLAAPDIQLSCVAAADDSRPYLPFATPRTADSFSVRATLLRPSGAGSVTIASANPLDPPVVHQPWCDTQSNLETLAKGLAVVDEIASQQPMGNIVAGSTALGGWAERMDYAKRNASSLHHPCSTCRMPASKWVTSTRGAGFIFAKPGKTTDA